MSVQLFHQCHFLYHFSLKFNKKSEGNSGTNKFLPVYTCVSHTIPALNEKQPYMRKDHLLDVNFTRAEYVYKPIIVCVYCLNISMYHLGYTQYMTAQKKNEILLNFYFFLLFGVHHRKQLDCHTDKVRTLRLPSADTYAKSIIRLFLCFWGGGGGIFFFFFNVMLKFENFNTKKKNLKKY